MTLSLIHICNISAADFAEAINDKTILVSAMYINNEIGSIKMCIRDRQLPMPLIKNQNENRMAIMPYL